MAQIGKKRIFYINSSNRISGTSNNFTIQLQMPLDEHYDRVTVLQANIPVSYYIVQAGLNTFQFKEPSHPAVTVTIPAGNYNANSFAVVVGSQLTSNSPNGLTYTITYPSSFTQNNTGQFTYTVNSTSSPIQFIFGSAPVYEQFGFSPNATYTFTVGATTSTLISINVVKFIPEDTLFIHSDICDGGDTDILQEIYNNNNSALSNISFLSTDPLSYSKKLRTNANMTATFSLTDESNEPINLNGLNMLITIMIYKDNRFYQQFEQYLKMKLSEDHHHEDNITPTPE
jgi:hypothetical protein